MSGLVIRPASMADLDSLIALYEAARSWLAEKGSDQWAMNTPDKTRTKISHSIKRGECYVAEAGDQPIGMITVDEFADPEFWQSEDRPGDALYVHRMVVDRSVAGANVGSILLEHAERVAATHGKRWLRLDAWRTNPSLHAYYKGQGFDAVRVVNLNHRGSGALFQRRVGLRKDA